MRVARRGVAAIVVSASMLAIAGCGLKGNLVLPAPLPPAPAASAASQPAH